MDVIEITLKKITPKKGYLLTNGEVTTNVLYMRNIPAADVWWEIVDEDYIPVYDGSEFLYPLTWHLGDMVTAGLWYTDGEDIWEAIKDGIPLDFNDKNYFDIV